LHLFIKYKESAKKPGITEGDIPKNAYLGEKWGILNLLNKFSVPEVEYVGICSESNNWTD